MADFGRCSEDFCVVPSRWTLSAWSWASVGGCRVGRVRDFLVFGRSHRVHVVQVGRFRFPIHFIGRLHVFALVFRVLLKGRERFQKDLTDFRSDQINFVDPFQCSQFSDRTLTDVSTSFYNFLNQEQRESKATDLVHLPAAHLQLLDGFAQLPLLPEQLLIVRWSTLKGRTATVQVHFLLQTTFVHARGFQAALKA